MVQGATFKSGFASGFASSFFSPGTELGGDGAGGFTLRTTIAGVVGGTASEIGGGKFANGAVSGAFVHMFNAENIGALGNAIRHRLDSIFEKRMFTRYWLGRGDYTLTSSEFKDITNGLNLKEGANQVSFYNNSKYNGAFGTATVYADSNGNAIGFYDKYDFDMKSWFGEGSRSSFLSEIKTDLVYGASMFQSQSKSFEIYYK